MRPRWLESVYNYWVYVPVVRPMPARMLAVLKGNVETDHLEAPRKRSWKRQKRSRILITSRPGVKQRLSQVKVATATTF